MLVCLTVVAALLMLAFNGPYNRLHAEKSHGGGHASKPDSSPAAVLTQAI